MKKFLVALTLFSLIICSTSMIAFGLNVVEPVQVNYKNGIYHIIIDGKREAKNIRFISSEKLITNSEAHNMSGSRLTINAGFFDPKNQKTISYIVTDRNTVADPLLNENLFLNPTLRLHMEQILNRTEFRQVECNGRYHYEIVPHKTPVDFPCNIVTSAQGGPLILPELKLEDEFFVLKQDGKVVRESASVLEKTARTIIGLKGDEIHILIITDKNPKNMYEVQKMCEALGLERAMGFDGGSSTSLNYKKSIKVVSTSSASGRMLKSFMLLK